MAVALSVTAVALNGNAYTGTDGIPVANIIRVRPANANEIASFSTALTAIEFKDISYASIKKSTELTATATATVITAMNA